MSDKHNYWRIPLAAGLGGLIGTWTSTLIPHPTLWITLLALTVGTGIGWLVGYLAYKLEDVAQAAKSAWVCASDSASHLPAVIITALKRPRPRIRIRMVASVNSTITAAHVWFLFVMYLLVSPVVMPHQQLGNPTSWVPFTLIPIAVYVLTMLVEQVGWYTIDRLSSDSFPNLWQTHWASQEDSSRVAKWARETEVHNLKTCMTFLGQIVLGFLLGLITVAGSVIYALTVTPVALSIWAWQLVKIINCSQRRSCGFGAVIGTVIGFFYQAPHIGFISAAVAGWVAWYGLMHLPSISVRPIHETAWHAWNSRCLGAIVRWMNFQPIPLTDPAA